jgi:T5SS/PEP-CTERM-associated repeat protein
MMRRFSTALGAVALLLGSTHALRADVTAEGDVSPGAAVSGIWVPFNGLDILEGGDVGGTIIVGGTGNPATDTTVGIMVIDLPAFTDPLTSDNGYIGGATEDLGFDGMGEVTVTGLNSEWTVDNQMIVGLSGTGYLNVLSGAIVEAETTAETLDDQGLILGLESGAQGYATVNGFGSRLVSVNAVIGNRGNGRIDVTARGRLTTLEEAAIGSQAELFPTEGEVGVGYVLVDGRGSRWNVGDISGNSSSATRRLTVGEEGRGGLEVRNAGWVNVESDVLIGSLVTGGIESYGQVWVNGQDSLLWTFDQIFVGSATTAAAGELYVQNAGVARADTSIVTSVRGTIIMGGGTLLTPIVTNNGVIRGYGLIDAYGTGVTNNGFIRNAGNSVTREYLKITGPVLNNDNIESIGGEMEFEDVVTNNGPNGDIVGKDAIFRFNAGVVNTGNVFLDNTIVWSPGTFTSSANLVLDSSTSTMIGDMALTSTNNLLVELGNEFSRLEITGDIAIDGNVFVSLGDDYIPEAGDAFEIIQADGLSGTFDNLFESISGFAFNLSYTNTSAIITIDTGFVFDADFNNNGTVDGPDLAIWQANFGMMVPPGTLGDADGDGDVDGNDFDIWQETLGTMPIVGAGNPNAGAVPEPASAVMLMVAMALAGQARRRRCHV